MRKLFISTLLLLSILSAAAQNSINGKVVDENDRPLIGATVTLKQISKKTVTNSQGEFSFKNLSDYAYTVAVKYLGYDIYEANIQSSSNNIIQLKRSPIDLEQVTVFATRANDRSPVAYTNISKQEISKMNLGQDLPYLLALTPSFITTSDAGTGIGYTGFRIRGTDSNRTNVTINGIPYNDSESHGVFFVDLPDFASTLNSVQVQRGVGTSTNGAAAFGASINFQTENINPLPYAEIETSIGSFNTMKNTLKAGTGLINKFAVDVRLSNVMSSGFIDRASVDMKSYFISAGYYGEQTLLKFITFGGKEKSYQAWNGVDLDNYPRTYNELGKYTGKNGETKFYDNQIDNYGQYNYQLLLTHVINPALNLNAALHYTRGIGYYEEYKDGRQFAEYGLTPDTINGTARKTTDLIRQKWLDNHFGGFTFSLNYNKEKYALTFGAAANKYFGDHYGRVLWARYANNFDPEQPYYFNKGTKTDANVFVKAQYDFMDNLTAFVDLQYRYINLTMSGQDEKIIDEVTGKRPLIDQIHPFHFFNPKAGLNYEISKNNNIFASFAIANREPNRTNYTDAGPNERPTSERLYDTELGYKFASPDFTFGANLYYMSYKNQLILTGKISEIGEMLTSNIPDSYRGGIELMAGVKIINGLRWNGNLNLSQNKIKNFTEYVDEYDTDRNWTGTKENFFKTTNISYSPNIVGNSTFSYSYKNFETGFISTYVGRQYLDNTSDVNRSINPYFVNNLRFGYSWKLNKIKSIDFNLLVNNLFNAMYETNGYNWYTYYLGGERMNEKRYFPQAGINFLFSSAVKL
ncbi:MAG: TonB-dependent receptor [Paludibacteraceae bacterium]